MCVRPRGGEKKIGRWRPELNAIAEHTARRGSGRVGRTEAAGCTLEESLTAALIAAVRHKHTRYDELLARGMDRATARRQVAGKIQEILTSWRTPPRGHTI